MNIRRQRVVIVGGGFGGLRTALQLAKRRAYEVILVDPNDAHVYTPWLYEVASGRTDHLPPSNARALKHSAGIPFGRLLRDTGVQFRKAKVVGVDAALRHVVFADHMTLAFDALVIAVGSESTYFGIPGLQEHALPLKTLTDAQHILSCMTGTLDAAEHRDVHLVVGGAGPSGVELVAELASMVRARVAGGSIPRGRVHLMLVDAGSRVLGTCAPAVSRATQRRLETLGIRVLLDTMVTKVSTRGVTLAPRPRRDNDTGPSASPFSAPTDVPADCMVWCGGVAPNALTAALPFPKDPRGRILVDRTFEVVGHTNIFALGDSAILADAAAPKLPQTAQAADEVSAIVARNVAAALAGRALAAWTPPASWPFVVAVGGRYGVAHIFGVLVTGVFAYALRRAADMRYMFRILPPLAAYRVWRSRMTLYAKND